MQRNIRGRTSNTQLAPPRRATFYFDALVLAFLGFFFVLVAFFAGADAVDFTFAGWAGLAAGATAAAGVSGCGLTAGGGVEGDVCAETVSAATPKTAPISVAKSLLMIAKSFESGHKIVPCAHNVAWAAVVDAFANLANS
jgi:hypothetical protein